MRKPKRMLTARGRSSPPPPPPPRRPPRRLPTRTGGCRSCALPWPPAKVAGRRSRAGWSGQRTPSRKEQATRKRSPPGRRGRPQSSSRPSAGAEMPCGASGESPPRRTGGSPRSARPSRAGPWTSQANSPPPGAHAERLAEEVSRAESAAAEAGEEIQAEWGATLEAARQEAEKHRESTDGERQTLARKLKRFGDVNLLALSQEEGLRERHEFVSAQRADAEAAANELNRIIQSVDREIEARFSETFGRVREAFGEMVPRMLEGSSGVLDLSEEGVEIGLRLGRKGWRPLRVLSGGETGAARALVPVQRVSEPAGGGFGGFLRARRGRGGARRSQPGPFSLCGRLSPGKRPVSAGHPSETNDGRGGRALRGDSGCLRGHHCCVEAFAGRVRSRLWRARGVVFSDESTDEEQENGPAVASEPERYYRRCRGGNGHLDADLESP